MDRILKRVAGFLRWLLASERLPDAAPPNERKRSITAWLLAPDALEATRTDGPHRRPPGILSAVLAPETLPQRDAPARDGASRIGFLRRLLAPETLPRDDAPATNGASRTGFLKWLLSPQELPRVQPLPRPQGRGFVRQLLSRDEL